MEPQQLHILDLVSITGNVTNLFHYIHQGVPIRIELGPKDLAQQQLVAVRRDTGVKVTIKRDNAVQEIVKLLDTIQADMLAKWVF